MGHFVGIKTSQQAVPEAAKKPGLFSGCREPGGPSSTYAGNPRFALVVTFRRRYCVGRIAGPAPVLRRFGWPANLVARKPLPGGYSRKPYPERSEK